MAESRRIMPGEPWEKYEPSGRCQQGALVTESRIPAITHGQPPHIRLR